MALVVGKLAKVLEAFALARVHLLPGGELENYLPSYDKNPYSIPDTEKSRTLIDEREYLLAGVSATELKNRYGDLLPILDKACGILRIEILPYLRTPIGDWIHLVQKAYEAGELTDIISLQKHPMLEWAAYQRILTIESFQPIDQVAFTCTIRLLPLFDPEQQAIQFSHETVAARINFA